MILSDGSVVWIVDDVRDGLMVGGIGLDYTLRTGRVKANGALLQRSSYPRLFEWVERNKGTISTTEADWQKDFNRYQFTLGDGSTTFRVPDLRGKWLQAAENIGLLAAGLPEISGGVEGVARGVSGSGVGAFSGNFNDASRPLVNPGSTGFMTQINFSARSYNAIYGNANTVQPPSIQLIVQIRY